ncbi:MAG: long-chain fatty acid--CoA ligase [Saprospiraceae bacterium]|nr:long-chain fatty acid--CoA ligase [Saprospiraceae bacterium]
MKDWTSKWALYSPDKTALKEYETGRTLTYGQLNRLGNRMAHHLQRTFGVGKGDRVAVLAENCLEYVVLFAAAQKLGFILVPLNYRLAAPEIDFLLCNAEPHLVLAEAKYQPLLESTPSLSKIPHRWALEALAERAIPTTDTPDDPHFPAVELSDDDPVFILYTSGTTGFPKGALYTHGMLFWNSINTAISLIVNSESRSLNVMPPFHTGGWNVLVTPFLHHGGYTCLFKKFEPEAVLQALEEERCTLFMGVPTMLKMLADEPGFGRADLSSLHYLIVGGEPMPIPLIERWHDKGVYVRQGYGMTEVGPNLTSLHQDDAVRKKGSIGRPNFYVQVRIAPLKTQNSKLETVGELLLRGPMVTPGYWRNPDATAAALRDGWFHSGDMARMDAEGYLYIVDRIKNMFISGGENVYPAEVERVLLLHPSVAEAAVIGVPDDKWGEVGRAFVVCRAGQVVSEADLLEHCRANLAKFKVPRSVVFVEALPKNDTGKIDRQALGWT